jgi:hypothetical protein
MDVLGIRLLPADDQQAPRDDRPFQLPASVRSVAAVEVQGTDLERMGEQARMAVAKVLRTLRVALHNGMGINPKQLRFRTSTLYAFDDTSYGWSERPDVAYPLTLTQPALDKVSEHPVAAVPAQPVTGVEQQANIALSWIERSIFADDPLVALLYLFFALEALIGDTSEGPKAHGLAFRQAMLSHMASGGFSHPSKTVFLYTDVRNAAVHGGSVQGVDWDLVHNSPRTSGRCSGMPSPLPRVSESATEPSSCARSTDMQIVRS